MTEDKENIEFIDHKIELKELKINSIKDFLDGSLLTRRWVVKQLPFIIYLAIFAVFYIGNRYHSERITRHTVKIQEEVKELRAQAISTSSELMNISKQSEVLRLVENNKLGLQESMVPPKKIIIKRK